MPLAVVHGEALALALAATRTAQSDSAEAERLVSSALRLAPDDVEVRAAAERAHGLLAATRGDLTGAARHLRRSAHLADAHGLVERSCEAHGTLAYVLLLTTGSRAALRELARAEAAGPTGLTAARLGMQRGLVLQELHRLEESDRELTGALAAIRSAGGDDLLEGDVRTNRAFGRIDLADWAGAREDLAEAERIYLSLGHTGRTAMVLHDLGTLEARRGDLPAALAAYDAAADRYREAGLDANLLPVETRRRPPRRVPGRRGVRGGAAGRGALRGAGQPRRPRAGAAHPGRGGPAGRRPRAGRRAGAARATIRAAAAPSALGSARRPSADAGTLARRRHHRRGAARGKAQRRGAASGGLAGAGRRRHPRRGPHRRFP